MRSWCVILAVIAGCDRGSSCKDAVLEVQTRLALDRNETEKMIGRCEMKPWTGTEHACVRAAGDIKSLIMCSRDADLELTAMSQFADRICACTAADCVQRASNEMTAWTQEMVKAHQDPPRMTEAETRSATVLGEKIGKCMLDVLRAAPNPPPTRR
jgi:hypothetical protein